MTDRLSNLVLAAGGLLTVLLFVYLAFSQPGYFSSPVFLGGFIGLEFLLVSLWMYRRIFLPIVVVAFLLAGVDLPVVASIWTAGRWFFLAAGAVVGSFIMLKERAQHFGLFHAMAIFAVAAALISAAVSRYPSFALLKALSLVLLFLYAGTGARLAAAGRENRFLEGLLAGSELFVAGVALFYLIGREVMGNPNSLGAVMGVVGAPVLLWGMLVAERPGVRHRRAVLYGIAMFLAFHSRSRAGLAAAFVSCIVLCLALRRYKLIGQGVVILVILATTAAIVDPEGFSSTISLFSTSIVYKDRDAGLGVFASRQTPWQGAMDSIRKHWWFGAGFGTTDNGQDASAHLSKFSTIEGVTSENGSSYLTIFTWVGVLGVLPFVVLILSLCAKVLRTVLWMLNTGSPFHPAIPLAIVTLAGLVHATFEDWLFAPGYYLCVFFWAMAFILSDVAPWAPLPSFSHSWRPWLLRQGPQVVAPGR